MTHLPTKKANDGPVQLRVKYLCYVQEKKASSTHVKNFVTNMIFRHKQIIIWLIAILLFLNSSSQLWAQKTQYYLQQPYLEAGVGTSLITHPHIAHTDRDRIPLLCYLELGKIKKRLALNVSFSFNESHTVNNYNYQPKYITTLLKPYFISLDLNKSLVELFGLIGANWAITSLIDKGNSQVITYENKKETNQTIGLSFGFGIQYVKNHLVYRVQWLNMRSKSRFLAGGFEKTDFAVGSNQIQMTVGYRFKKQIEKKRNEKLCSTYQ